MTLSTLVVADTSGTMNCDEPGSGLLGQGEAYQCQGFHEVCKAGEWMLKNVDKLAKLFFALLVFVTLFVGVGCCEDIVFRHDSSRK